MAAPLVTRESRMRQRRGRAAARLRRHASRAGRGEHAGFRKSGGRYSEGRPAGRAGLWNCARAWVPSSARPRRTGPKPLWRTLARIRNGNPALQRAAQRARIATPIGVRVPSRCTDQRSVTGTRTPRATTNEACAMPLRHTIVPQPAEVRLVRFRDRQARWTGRRPKAREEIPLSIDQKRIRISK